MEFLIRFPLIAAAEPVHGATATYGSSLENILYLSIAVFLILLNGSRALGSDLFIVTVEQSGGYLTGNLLYRIPKGIVGQMRVALGCLRLSVAQEFACDVKAVSAAHSQ